MATATTVSDEDLATLLGRTIEDSSYAREMGSLHAFSFRQAVAKEFGLSEAKATTLVRDAANRVVIVKLGQGSATKYTTVALRQAQIARYREVHQRIGKVLARLEEIGAPEPWLRWVRPDDVVEQFRSSADVSWQLVEQLLTLVPEGAKLSQSITEGDDTLE